MKRADAEGEQASGDNMEDECLIDSSNADSNDEVRSKMGGEGGVLASLPFSILDVGVG